jgi:hypothetical protein
MMKLYVLERESLGCSGVQTRGAPPIFTALCKCQTHSYTHVTNCHDPARRPLNTLTSCLETGKCGVRTMGLAMTSIARRIVRAHSLVPSRLTDVDVPIANMETKKQYTVFHNFK